MSRGGGSWTRRSTLQPHVIASQQRRGQQLVANTALSWLRFAHVFYSHEWTCSARTGGHGPSRFAAITGTRGDRAGSSCRGVPARSAQPESRTTSATRGELHGTSLRLQGRAHAHPCHRSPSACGWPTYAIARTVEEFPYRPLGSEHVKGHMLPMLRNDLMFTLRV
jgi:hypothetical protein